MMTNKQSAELARICKASGGILRVRDVEMAARKPKNPLHDLFEWDESAAALLWRWQQARLIIVRVKAPLTKGGEPIQVYVSVSTDQTEDGGGYRHIREVSANDEMYKTYLNDVFKEFERFRQKFEHIKALKEMLQPVFAAIDEIEREQPTA